MLRGRSFQKYSVKSDRYSHASYNPLLPGSELAPAPGAAGHPAFSLEKPEKERREGDRRGVREDWGTMLSGPMEHQERTVCVKALTDAQPRSLARGWLWTTATGMALRGRLCRPSRGGTAHKLLK